MKNKKILIGGALGYIALVVVITVVLVAFLSAEQFFFHLATAIILSWVILLIVYFIWAIFFYNVNMGWTDEDWEDLVTRKKEGHKEGILDDEPVENPHANETLGLPPGTIRGTIALSLLVTGLALVIASFQMNATYSANSLFVDNFEFFKTAFLMMIAFYFGNKSIEAINNRNQGVHFPGGNKEKPKRKKYPSIVPDHSVGHGGSMRSILQDDEPGAPSSGKTSKDVDDSDSVFS